MFRITKEFAFSASHQLHGLPEGHQCGRLHGHNYVVEVELCGNDLDQHGFVVDYGELGGFKTWLDDNWDHRHLNDVVTGQPSAELMARLLFAVAASMLCNLDGFGNRWTLTAVRVRETPKTCAEYSP